MSEERKVTSNFRKEGARLIYRNFAGKPSQYNAEGNRNFGVLLSDEDAEMLKEDGWNVKYRKPDENGYEQPWLPVKVKFGDIPPICQLINSRGKMKLDEETIDQLDWCYIENCDLVIRPYNYPAMIGKDGSIIRPSGVAAYLKSIYVKIREDDFEAKYAELPDLDNHVIRGDD